MSESEKRSSVILDLLRRFGLHPLGGTVLEPGLVTAEAAAPLQPAGEPAEPPETPEPPEAEIKN